MLCIENVPLQNFKWYWITIGDRLEKRRAAESSTRYSFKRRFCFYHSERFRAAPLSNYLHVWLGFHLFLYTYIKHEPNDFKIIDWCLDIFRVGSAYQRPLNSNCLKINWSVKIYFDFYKTFAKINDLYFIHTIEEWTHIHFAKLFAVRR